MIDDLIIRACREEDIESLEGVIPTGSNQFHLLRFHNQKAAKSLYLVAFIDGRPVGHLDILWNVPGDVVKAKCFRNCPELNGIVVIPELRSKGIGSALINCAEDLIGAKGFRKACLGVATDNPRARKLYEKLGYKDWGQGVITEFREQTDDNGKQKIVTEAVLYLLKDLKPIVYMLCGLTGSGKTTYAKKLEARGIERLAVDEFIFERHGRYGVDYHEREYPKYYDPAEAELKDRLIDLIKSGASVVLDYGFWNKSQRDEYKKAIEENGGDWKLLYFKADKETLQRRLEERNKRSDANALTVTKHALEDFIERFEEPNAEGEIVIFDR